jgi:alpha-L-fucosidase 2
VSASGGSAGQAYGGATNGGVGTSGGLNSGGGAGLAAGAAGMAVDLTASFPKLAGTYEGVFTAPPTLNDTDETTDAPLLGNGDLGVSMQNNIDTLTFILGKNEFWSLSGGSVKAMARLALAIPGMANATYSAKEDIGPAEVNGSFVSNGQTITSKSWVQADDTTKNELVTELTYTGTGTQDITVSLAPGAGNSNPSAVGAMADVLYIDVRADSADKVGNYDTHRARVATRLIGGAATVANNQLKFTLAAGQTYSLVSSIMSLEDDPAYQQKALAAVATLQQADVASLLTTHHAWWDAFYAQSFVEIPNKVIEKEYYASLYLLASTSRTGEAAPGLWGNWVMKDPAWNGDYTLNYNYEAPFYAAFPTNHVELANNYDKAVIDWVPKAQAEATANGWTGAFYRVHIGPLPNGSADTSEHNQKSIGAFAATDMIMHYYYTLDPAYASAIYPTLKQMAVFWESYLVKDGNNYDIVDDAQQEDDPSPQTNGIMSLGLLRFLLQACIDLSTALNLDTTERAVWQDRLTNLSPYPTFTMSGKTVFRWTSLGRDWADGNDIGSQVIYPASQIGLGSDATLLQTAQNMVSVMARWSDGNGTDTFYPAAARVGSEPTALLGHLQDWIENNTYPNLHIHTGGGGIENLNTVPSAVDEMLLQSFQGKLRLFSDWPTGVDARFGDLRAYGAFLISSDVRSNVVQYLRVVSEHGGPAVFINPWPGTTLHVYRNAVDSGTLSGAEITLPTAVNEVIHIAPDGTTYQAILDKMSLPLSGATTP